MVPIKRIFDIRNSVDPARHTDQHKYRLVFFYPATIGCHFLERLVYRENAPHSVDMPYGVPDVTNWLSDKISTPYLRFIV